MSFLITTTLAGTLAGSLAGTLLGTAGGTLTESPVLTPSPLSAPSAPAAALRSLARTPGARIRLIDVLDPDDAGRVEPSLLQTDLGRSPSPGFGRRLDRRAIEAAIPEGVLQLTGPKEVLVQTDVVRIDPHDVVADAERLLRESLYLPFDAEVEVARAPYEKQVPRGRLGVELSPRLRGTPVPRGNVTVDVEIQVDGRPAGNLPVTFLIRTYEQLPVLAKAVQRGATLRAADLDHRRVETTRLATLPLADASSLIGMLARRQLQVGSFLASKDFEFPVLVKRNQPVTITFKSGALRVETFGIARGEGSIDDIIRVENLKTRKIVYGRVVGLGVVETNR